MQVLCMAAHDGQGDVQCPCCKQSYKVYYSRIREGECEEALEAVRAVLVEPPASMYPSGAGLCTLLLRRCSAALPCAARHSRRSRLWHRARDNAGSPSRLREGRSER